ncbi:hypothetical protein J437_LFUL002344 [Ladona fulva]|uniref:RING-type domain-containing protein n=1 Tax=Ladona fulva TaxID=123851 RepID=A0A8K0K8Q2_LADFU|nr:hypothetical protein J437_LFUL002344 [Ladona fulva]
MSLNPCTVSLVTESLANIILSIKREMEADQHLGALIRDRGQEQTKLVRRLQRDAELQRAAVGALLERGDARSWGLAQEVAMVQAQLASLTAVDLSEKRTALSSLLVDLIGQQAERRQQLLDQLKELEKRNVTHTAEDFWLFQYQRLLDSRPQCLAEAERSVDPKLVHHLLLAGALHCLPLLARTLLMPSPSCSSPFSHIKEPTSGDIVHLDHEALMNAGLKEERDREAILRAVHNYNTEKRMTLGTSLVQPSAPEIELIEEDILPQTPPFISSNTMGHCECAVCMDKECEVIFIPCGHMCCCISCSEKFTECPMCRGNVEQKIRVIIG